MKITLLKYENSLKADTSEAEDQLAKIGNMERVNCNVQKIRNPQLHRKYFAFINIVWENLPEHLEEHFPSKDTLRKSLQMYAGHYDECVSLKGQRILMPRSIAYNELDELQFKELYDAVLQVVRKHIIPELDDSTINKMEEFYA